MTDEGRVKVDDGRIIEDEKVGRFEDRSWENGKLRR